MDNMQNAVYITRKRWLTAVAAIVWAAVTAGLIALVYVASKKAGAPTVPVIVATVFFGSIGLVNCALCVRNLFFRFAIVIDDSGIYDFTGFVHCGFVPWGDIEGVDAGGLLADFVLEDGAPTVRLPLKLPKATFAGKNFLWKAAYVLTQSPYVKLRTMGANVKKGELAALIKTRLESTSGGGIEQR